MKKIILDKAHDVTISPHIVTTNIKPTFLVCPGGAYKTCDESESDPVVRKFNSLGYNVFVLRYSVGKNYRWPRPLEDFDSGMEYLIAHAAELYIDVAHIVALGFSAGGHVVSTAISASHRKPYAAALLYGLTAAETLSYCAPDAPDASTLVNQDTRPCFIAIGRNDWIVPCFNATTMLNAFQEYFIDYEAHIYGYAMHGFSVGNGKPSIRDRLFCGRVDGWVEDFIGWLNELLSGKYASFRENAEFNDKFSAEFSTKNSCELIFSCEQAKSLIKRRFPMQYGLYALSQKKIGDFLGTVSLRNLLELLNVDENKLSEMDKALNEIIIER